MHDVAEGKTAGQNEDGKKRGLARVTGGRTQQPAPWVCSARFSPMPAGKIRPDNPARGVRRFADRKRERRLSDDEYAALGAALREAEARRSSGRQRLPWRGSWRLRAGVLARRWICAGRKSTLRDARRSSATQRQGRSIRPLSHAACDVLTVPTADGRRSSIPGIARRTGDDPAFQEILAADRQARRAGGRRDAARAAPFLRHARRRPRLQRADDRRAGRAQGTLDHFAIRACCRCGVARRGRRGGEPHGASLWARPSRRPKWCRCAPRDSFRSRRIGDEPKAGTAPAFRRDHLAGRQRRRNALHFLIFPNRHPKRSGHASTGNFTARIGRSETSCRGSSSATLHKFVDTPAISFPRGTRIG